MGHTHRSQVWVHLGIWSQSYSLGPLDMSPYFVAMGPYCDPISRKVKSLIGSVEKLGGPYKIRLLFDTMLRGLMRRAFTLFSYSYSYSYCF